MNDRIKQIITVVLENRVVSAETNLSATHRNIIAIEPKMYHYRKFLEELREKNYITYTVDDKTYHIEVTKNEKVLFPEKLKLASKIIAEVGLPNAIK